MPLILAIEPDRRQASQLKRLTRGCAADLVLADTTERALEAIGNRIPDLVLVPALLSPQDDAALATALRVIAAAAHVQTLTIPVFASQAAPTGGGVLAKWRRGRARPASEGCDPAVFADQIAAYLAEAAAARAELAPFAEDAEEIAAFAEPVDGAPAPQPAAPQAEPEAEWEPLVFETEPIEEVAEQLESFVETPLVLDAAEIAPEPVARADKSEAWAAMSLAPHRWPRLDVAPAPRVVSAAPKAPVKQPEPVVVAAAPRAEPVRQEPARAEAPRTEWLDMLDALRHDIDRLRVQRTEAPAPKAAVRAQPAPPAKAAAKPAAKPAAAPAPAAAPRKQKRTKDAVPVQDEWGFFDPQQCGFTALLAKLDEISHTDQ